MESSAFSVAAELHKCNSVGVSKLRRSGNRTVNFSFKNRVGCFTSTDITLESGDFSCAYSLQINCHYDFAGLEKAVGLKERMII